MRSFDLLTTKCQPMDVQLVVFGVFKTLVKSVILHTTTGEAGVLHWAAARFQAQPFAGAAAQWCGGSAALRPVGGPT